MILPLCLGVAALGICALLVGVALDSLGLRCGPAAPAVGLFALIIIAFASIKLPGRAVTAAIILLIVVLLAAWRVWTRRRTMTVSVAPVAALAVTGFGVALPFLATGRVGVLGVGLDNDSANHLLWAQSLRSAASAARYPPTPGYPLGPHSLFDALSTGLGVRLDLALTALTIVPILMIALVAAGALTGRSGWRRAVTGAVAGLLYLPAAYYGQSSFKESLMGLVLLGFVVHLESLRAARRGGGRLTWQSLLPIPILWAGAIYVYSYPALAWLVLTAFIWAAAELFVRRAQWRRWRPAALDHAMEAVVGVIVFGILLLPIIPSIYDFLRHVGVSPAGSGAITTGNLGDLAGPLSPYEALGLWDNADFRFPPANLFHAGELGAFALALLVFGILIAVRRRDFALPAAVLASALVYLVASHGQSPYVSAKALVIGGPLVAVLICRGLFGATPTPLSRWAAGARLAAAAIFVGFAAYSSFLVLRGSYVWAPASPRELMALDRTVRGHTVLFLGDTDYASWIFDNAEMSTLDPNSVSSGPTQLTLAKPNTQGTAFDIDSVIPQLVNRFQYVITTTTSFASQVPKAFRLVKREPMYELWRRVGFMRSRSIIEAPGQPGAFLDCKTTAGRGLSRHAGVAAVMKPPVTAAVPPMLPGHANVVPITLPAGRWSLSLSYFSQDALTVTAAGHRWRMPAYNDRIGPYFAVGSLESHGGTIDVTIRQQRPSPFTGTTPAIFTALAAVPDPDPRRLIPLRRACGRYIDWYRLKGGAVSS